MKKIYLTIDDGPTSHTKTKLQFLKKHNIPAILFFRGENIEKHPDQVYFAIEEGFQIGNHSYNHPYFSKITLQEAIDQILVTEELLENAYQKIGSLRTSKLFRFPYMDKGGAHKEELQQFLKEKNFKRLSFDNIIYNYYKERNLAMDIDVSWTFDACEYALFHETYMKKYQLFTANDFVKRMHQNDPENGFGLLSTSSDIILLHDFEQTHAIFEPMIENLLQMHLNFSSPKII